LITFANPHIKSVKQIFKMNHRSSSLHLLGMMLMGSVALTATSVDAYAAAGIFASPRKNWVDPSPRPVAFERPVPVPKEESKDIPVVSPPKATSQYQLGIGRNPPVLKGSTTNTAPSCLPLTHEEAFQYLDCMEHQATREYPSPAFVANAASKEDARRDSMPAIAFTTLQEKTPETDAATSSTPSTTDGNKKKKLQVIRYNRRSEDVLTISSSRSNKKQPTIVAHTREKLDVNTAWVEMLLHSENMKAAQQH